MSKIKHKFTHRIAILKLRSEKRKVKKEMHEAAIVFMQLKRKMTSLINAEKQLLDLSEEPVEEPEKLMQLSFLMAVA